MPQFKRLEEALANRRIALQHTSLGIEPEQVLVLETVGSVENFIRAVENIEGLEWLAEYELSDIPQGDGFEDTQHPEKSLSGQLFLLMSDQRALEELRRAFELWCKEPDTQFRNGLATLKQVFDHLRRIRPWDVEDRLRDTGLLEDWNEQLAHGQGTVSFEAELWCRRNESQRSDAGEQIHQVVEELGGEILRECVLEDIGYHAILGRIGIDRVKELLEQPTAYPDLELFRCDQVMYFRPVGQCGVPIQDELAEFEPAGQPRPQSRVQGTPVVALLDGMPLTGHVLLDGHLVVDDPDEYEDAYQARERCHGTAMASLICHDDLNGQGMALGRPIYVRPIMQPRRGFNNRFVETVPDDILPVDLIHRAVTRLFEGEGAEPPASPGIRVINLSIGNHAHPFVREMSSWARLIDWLSWKYNVLFIVSAGNHAYDILFDKSNRYLQNFSKEKRRTSIIQAVVSDTKNRRLLSPAETLNGLTVGAIHTDESGPVPEHLVDPLMTAMPSVFSAHGPGYRRAIKPDIHLPGGRQLLSSHPAPPAGTVLLKPVESGRRPGQRVATPGQSGTLDATQHMRGTSNATALGSRSAHVFYELLEALRGQSGREIPTEFDAVLMKALLVHGAEWNDEFREYLSILKGNRRGSKLREYGARFLGYGRPDIARVIDGAEQRVTILGFGSLLDGEAGEFSLPLPPSLSDFNAPWRSIVTLAWFSPICVRQQKYRAAHLWFGLPSGIERDQSYTDYRAVQRGTVQHEVFKGNYSLAVGEGGEMVVKVNCRKDAGNIFGPIRFGLVVTLEVPDELLFPIPIYEEVRERISARVRVGTEVG